MKVDTFWDLIKSSRSRISAVTPEGNMERQKLDLRHLLLQLSTEEIVQFRDELMGLLSEAFTYALWDAAFLIADGCSDDGFHDFRSWLISMGMEVFQKALVNPDSLAEPASASSVEDVFFEGFSILPDEAYRIKTGRNIPDYITTHPTYPRGNRMARNEADIKLRFPQLWKTFRE